MNRFLEWKWEILAPLFGVMLTLAFAPYDFAYLALIALAFFYRFCNELSAVRAAVTGYLFGLGLFGSGIWWVYVSMHDFGGANPLSAGFLTVLLIGLWAGFPALTAALSVKVFSKIGAGIRVIAFAWIWVAMEYVRGNWIFNGFPWLQVAYSQIETPLAGFAPIGGVYGSGFLLALSAAILAEIWCKRSLSRLGSVVLILIWGGGFGLKGGVWTHAIGEPITVTLVQGNIDQKQKWQPNQRLRTLTLYRHFTEQHWDSDVVIWPETSVPAFMMEVKDWFLDPLARQAREHGVDLVISLPVNGAGKDYYNSVITLGEHEALYHKIHLLPFGEYLPLQPLSGWVLDQLQIPLGNFTAGSDEQPLLQAGGYSFVTTICYEDAFGELVRRQAAQAAYLVNVTNDGWFGDTAEPHQHMQMAQMRALETGRYLVRATNTGLSGFVQPDGRLGKQAPLFTSMTLTDSIVPMAGSTPYVRLGDQGVFMVLIGLVALSQAWMCLPRRQQQAT